MLEKLRRQGNATSAAKAGLMLSDFYGTAEAVPLTSPRCSLFRACDLLLAGDELVTSDLATIHPEFGLTVVVIAIASRVRDVRNFC